MLSRRYQAQRGAMVTRLVYSSVAGVRLCSSTSGPSTASGSTTQTGAPPNPNPAAAGGGTSTAGTSGTTSGSKSTASFGGSPSEKPSVVVIGTGWAGARLVRDLDPNLCNIAVLSQRNHMLFTPLLPQTCSGTLEFRSICEPIVRVQPALAERPNCFFRTMVYDVDFENKTVNCVSPGVMDAGNTVAVQSFDFKYDILVLSHGARPNTFNIPGVEDHAFFLREISEARGVRRRLVQNIMTANLAVTDRVERDRLCHVVVVGGGPTGVEFASDLADFLHEDIPKIAPMLQKHFKVTLVEANEVLGTFDLALRNYGAHRLQKLGVQLRKAIVAEVTEDSVLLTDGEVLRCGLVVWSTGVGPSSLTKELKVDKAGGGRIAIDGQLRVLKNGKPLPDVYACGDCAASVEKPLPTLAAVASRQGKYLAKKLNSQLKGEKDESAFHYKHLGSMASLGRGAALVEFKSPATVDFKGLRAFLIWRSAYFTMLGSVRSRLYVMVNWFGSFIFGRDVTYIAEISEAKLWKNLAREGATKEQTRKKLLKEADQKKRQPISTKTLREEADADAKAPPQPGTVTK